MLRDGKDGLLQKADGDDMKIEPFSEKRSNEFLSFFNHLVFTTSVVVFATGLLRSSPPVKAQRRRPKFVKEYSEWHAYQQFGGKPMIIPNPLQILKQPILPF